MPSARQEVSTGCHPVGEKLCRYANRKEGECEHLVPELVALGTDDFAEESAEFSVGRLSVEPAKVRRPTNAITTR